MGPSPVTGGANMKLSASMGLRVGSSFIPPQPATQVEGFRALPPLDIRGDVITPNHCHIYQLGGQQCGEEALQTLQMRGQGSPT